VTRSGSKVRQVSPVAKWRHGSFGAIVVGPRRRRGRVVGFERDMRALSVLFSTLLLLLAHAAQAQPLTVDPESIVPLPDKFDMETPAPEVPPEIARFHARGIGTWHDDRHILVVERVKRDGRADVVFAQSDSAFYDLSREWWRSEATIANGVLTLTGFRTFRYAFDGPDRLYLTATLKSGSVTSGALVRTDAGRLAAGRATGRMAVAGRARAGPAPHGAHTRWRAADPARSDVLSACRASAGAARNLHPRIRRRPQSAEELVVLDRGTLASRQRFCRACADAPWTRRIRGNQRRGGLRARSRGAALSMLQQASHKASRTSSRRSPMAANCRACFYSERFRTVEINNTFYAMPKASVLEAWRTRFPPISNSGAQSAETAHAPARAQRCRRFAVAVSRSHRNVAAAPGAVAVSVAAAVAQGCAAAASVAGVAAAGGVAWPWSSATRRGSTTRFSDCCAIMVAALCLADAEGELDVPVVATTDWGYVRLRRPAYSAAALKAWVQRVREQDWRGRVRVLQARGYGQGGQRWQSASWSWPSRLAALRLWAHKTADFL